MAWLGSRDIGTIRKDIEERLSDLAKDNEARLKQIERCKQDIANNEERIKNNKSEIADLERYRNLSGNR